MSSEAMKLKIDPNLLKIARKIGRFKWRLGDWDITLKPTKGYHIFNFKTGSSNIAKFYQEYFGVINN